VRSIDKDVKGIYNTKGGLEGEERRRWATQ
jgi:hypothetical protein